MIELLEKQSGLHTSVDCSTPLTEQSLSRNDGEDQTRRNAENMFGAAFAAIDKRLPLLISELLTENTTLDDINKVISSVIPGAFSVEKKLLELLEKQSGLHTSVDCSTPLTEQSLSRNDGEDQTRRNAENMFGDD
ncbi:plasmid partitioning/stability family protein [Escherichia coli]|uniref:plasmid partitioning/stability family protein n=1 Tax=Escherichia coli TaxID=562 RepID=UPI001CC44FBC|nr:plasmid partitioning/stability family protein [Escherichia coli]